MATDLNLVILCGKLTQAPQFRAGRVEEQNSTRLYLNVPEFRADASHPNGGEHIPNVIMVEVQGKNAAKAADLKQDDRVLVEGRMKILEWDKKDRQGRVMYGEGGYKLTEKRIVVRTHAVKRGGPDNFNRALVIGRLGKDPNIKYFSTGSAKASFNVAANESVYDAGAKQRKDVADWLHVQIFGKRSESAAQYLKKGKMVLIEGALQWDVFEKEGANGEKTRETFCFIKAFGFEFVNGGGGQGQRGDVAAGGYDQVPDFDDSADFGPGAGEADHWGQSEYPDSAKPPEERNPVADDRSQQPPQLDDEIPF